MLDHRPVLPRRIVRVTSPDHSAVPRFKRKKYRAAPAFNHSHTEGAFFGSRQLPEYLLHEAPGFGDFIEAHSHPRRDIALGTPGLFDGEFAVGVTRQIAT